MSWIVESNLGFLEKLYLNVIKRGVVPHHVAFIMDGNRRFANKTKMSRADGHAKGFNKLTDVLRWCLELEIKEVTVYAFSLENFKRSKEEVDNLMDLAREKFKKLLEEKDKLMSEGINIRIIGELSKIPKDILKLMAEAVFITRENKRVRLTVAFAYTAQNEISNSIKNISEGVVNGLLYPDDITCNLIEKSLYTEDSEVPDLLIRTSGEVRLSDFMLWQTGWSYIYFTPVFWPEFTLWELLKAVFHYQRSFDTMNKVRRGECDLIKNERVERFLCDLYQSRFKQMRAALS